MRDGILHERKFEIALWFWMMDGTFRCCPRLFCQIYTIHAMVGAPQGSHKIVPLMYGLLSHKSERCYAFSLEILKCAVFNKLNVHLNPYIILTDFELAAMKYIKKIFPNCLNKLWLFHLNQSIYRHIQKAGLATRYNNDADFAHKMRHFGALAFLEPTETIEASVIIKVEIISDEAIDVITWFKKYYINRSMTISKSVSSKMTMKPCQPQFLATLWSVHDSILSYVPLSQNALESWHNRWNTIKSTKVKHI